MADLFLENGEVKVGINLHGAEMVSFIKKETGREYMWCGDGKYWGRVSPVLFPFVGKLNNLEYRYEGKVVGDIPQHGFARDSEFKVAFESKNEVWLEMMNNEKWDEKYPFKFTLRIGYMIEGKRLHVMWTVINNDSKTFYFSIGAHPAFAVYDEMPETFDSEKDYLRGFKLDFHKSISSLECGLLGSKGVLSVDKKEVSLNEGVLSLSKEVFAKDALVIDSEGINTVSLINQNNEEMLRVNFDAPQLGIWSPAGKNAPFVCIEPWFGRCDREGFNGELKDREYGNSLEPGHSFNKEYVIEII